MSESVNKEFEAYVNAEFGDIAVVSEGRYISPKIQNYYKVWQYQEAQLADAKQAARWESDVASQAIADLELYRKDTERYRWLSSYLISDDTSHDDNLVNASTPVELACVIDAAIAKEQA